ncbi:MAG: DNA-formamidopyrimidine glycosylase family protein [Nesterenkonia sp.]|nr:DNA-formamidopyrimidine glycosylase family protein [Nesterenkonia sp.]
MPEGDSVYRQAAQLHRVLAGRTLTTCDLRVPSYAAVDLSGRVVDDVVAHGKYLLCRIGDTVIRSHLKMEGVWHVYPLGPGRPRWRRAAHTARCVLATDEHQAVGFSLGELVVFPRSETAQRQQHLGPDLLGDDWDAQEALRRLRARPERAVGPALLDQHNLAGIGNVYRSEICFLAGVHPSAPVSAVPDLPGMVETAHRLLQVNRLRPRRVTTGTASAAVRTWVYGRDGQLCLRCRSRIVRAEIGEEEDRRRGRDDRVVHWCPHCQPQP